FFPHTVTTEIFTLSLHDALPIYNGAILKVTIETALLSLEEKILACQLALAAGADFVKSSTGFSHRGAIPADISLMRGVVGDKLGDRKSTRLNSSHVKISYAVFCL